MTNRFFERSRLALCALALASGASGCGLVLGLGDFKESGASGTGGTGGSGGSSGTSGSSTSGQPAVCTPGTQLKCVYTGPPSTESVGVCKAGVQVCKADGTGYDACAGEVLPAPKEDCTNKTDDDCNGTPNDGCPCTPGMSQACYSGAAGTEGVGICKAGTQTCNSDGLGFGPCAGEQVPLPEDCATPDDDDCNGMVNDASAGCVCTPGVTKACYGGPAGTADVGACKSGTQACSVTGKDFDSCIGDKLPGVENCTKIGDEDCNGFSCSEAIWAKKFGDSSYQHGNAIAVDKATGDVYVGGDFSGSLKFGNDQLFEIGNGDSFLAKFDTTGNYVWSKQFGDGNAQSLTSIAVDASGNVVVGGANLNGANNIIKLTSAGAVVWSVACINKNASSYFAGLTTDLQGNVIVGGNLAASATCSGQVVVGVAPPAHDVFIAKLSGLTGSSIWQKQFGDAADQFLTGDGLITDPGGNIFVVGALNGVINFGPGNVWTSAGGTDVFVAKLTSGGSVSWSERFGDAGTQQAYAIAIDSAGGPVVTGIYQGQIISGAKILSTPNPNTLSSFVAKFDNGGGTTWLNDMSAIPYRVAVDAQNDILIGTSFTGSVSFGGATLTSAGFEDIGVGKLTGATGASVWSKRYGDAASQQVHAICAGKLNEVFITGDLGGTVDFDGIVLNGTGMNNTDAFITKIAP